MLCAVECFEDGRVVIVGERGTVLLSADDGKTFTRLQHVTSGGTFWCCLRYKACFSLAARRGSSSRSESSERQSSHKPGRRVFPGRAARDAHCVATEATLGRTASSARAASVGAAAAAADREINGVWWTPALRAMLYPRRGGIATIVRPVPVLEEAWATLRRILWAADRAGMEKKKRASGIGRPSAPRARPGGSSASVCSTRTHAAERSRRM